MSTQHGLFVLLITENHLIIKLFHANEMVYVKQYQNILEWSVRGGGQMTPYGYARTHSFPIIVTDDIPYPWNSDTVL